jgi:hypothetical protein
VRHRAYTDGLVRTEHDPSAAASESVRLVTRTGVAELAAALKQDRPEIEVTRSFLQRINSVTSIGGFKRED